MGGHEPRHFVREPGVELVVRRILKEDASALFDLRRSEVGAALTEGLRCSGCSSSLGFVNAPDGAFVFCVGPPACMVSTSGPVVV